ncbi:hypothetical protein QUF72_03365 [Desulfobacterales bacterium HSG2]|nr:hypothetical protein [Desulfobacterales bacterium HSG2]
MLETKEIINLTDKINTELEHFVPCVASEIEAKTIIYRHLQEIRALVTEIREHKCAQQGDCCSSAKQIAIGEARSCACHN